MSKYCTPHNMPTDNCAWCDRDLMEMKMHIALSDRDALAAQVVQMRSVLDRLLELDTSDAPGITDWGNLDRLKRVVWGITSQARSAISTDPGPRVLALNELVRAAEAYEDYTTRTLKAYLEKEELALFDALAKWKAGT